MRLSDLLQMELQKESDSENNRIWNQICAKYCPRCVLRILCLSWDVIGKGENEVITYLQEKYQFQSLWNSNKEFTLEKTEPPLEKSSQAPCLGCVGILQSSFVENCAQTVRDEVSNDSYQFKSFQCMIFLPVHLVVSEHVAFSHFQQLFGQEKLQNQPFSVKDVLKSLLEPLISDKLGVERDKNSNFQISICITLPTSKEKVLSQLKFKSPKAFAAVKNKYGRKVFKTEGMFTIGQVKEAISNVSQSELMELCCSLTSLCETEVKLNHAPVYVGGRYNKYTRTLPQTPWLIDGVRKLESSVEEYLAKPLQRAFKADGYNFSSSGREDVDVRMLGNGRPFLFELLNSRFDMLDDCKMREIESEINSQTTDVSSSHLQVIEKVDCKQLKEGEIEKTKSYSATCYFIELPSKEQLEKLAKLSDLKDVEIKQKTPIRVLHRRTVATRPRMIHSMNVERLDGDPRLFKLKLSTQAGTYVKEFVHGDFGRTVPCLKDLLDANVDIIDLDVLSVDVHWPPRS